MCGRYTRTAAAKAIYDYFGIDPDDEFSVIRLAPSYNVAPQTMQPVVRLDLEIGKRELAIMRWGLVPFWSTDGKAGFNTINAKSETVATSPMFREAFKRRRCLVPATSFYEWKKVDAKMKQPYAIGLKDDSLFAFTGLWETWKDKATGHAIDTYTVITTDPNELIGGLSIHDRMPVILQKQDYERWLAPADPSRLPVDLLRPFPAEQMKAWKVGSSVGNVKNNSPGLLVPTA